MPYNNEILIYSHQLSNRLRYVVKLIVAQHLGLKYRFTTNQEELINHQGPKLNYSREQFQGEPFIASNELLFQGGIRDQDIHVFEHLNIPVFYFTSRKSILPFDVFAATFYLVSRYEEYLPVIRDKYERFEAASSLAHKHHFLRKPVVNYWIQFLKDKLQSIYPQLVFKPQHYQYLSTIDIDNAYAFQEKGIIRNLGSFIKHLLSLDLGMLLQRTRVLLGSEQDPYDTYEHQFQIQKKYGINTIYFFLVGDYGENDTNVSVNSAKFQGLIKSIADTCEIGIHPSFASNDVPGKTETEVKRLSKIVHKDITKSRQHFLRLRLPDTYRKLIELDITDDYTMGYASDIGFRAGICTPFNFYDIDSESETNLKIHSFAVMEATLKYYLKVQPDKAMEEIKPVIDEVKKVNGTFISLWHNETMSNWLMWKDWKELYEDVVAYAIKTN